MQLQQQIREATKTGDFETAQKLIGQLDSLHQEHVQQREQDLQAVKELRQDFRQYVKEARQENYLPSGEGYENSQGEGPLSGGLGNSPGYNPPGRGSMKNSNQGPGMKENKGGGGKRR